MAAQQVSHGDMGSHGHPLRLSSLSLAPIPATTFSRFGDLPFELQNMVWGQAYTTVKINLRLIVFTITLVEDPKSPGNDTMCFSRDAHAAASTRNLRSLMSVCRRARQKVLEFVTTLTLSCPNPADGKISEYMIPFDCEETCFCIQGWQELPGPRKAIHNTKGLDFARKIKRLAFVAKDYDVRERPLGPEHELRDCISEEVREDLETFFLLFHNAVQIAGISTSALGAREILGEEDFLSLFLFQPIMQKTMVDGFPITIPYFDRFRMIYHAWHAAFVNLDSRVRAALSPDRMRS